MTLAQRSVTSSAYNIGANTIRVVLGFVRSIVLARLLDPEVFGIYAFVTSVVALTRDLPGFGLHRAFPCRTEGDQEEQSLRVYFTLLILFGTIWALLLGLGAVVFAPPDTHWVFGIVIGTAFAACLIEAPRTILTKRMTFRRLAAAEIVVSVVVTVVSVGLAQLDLGLWCLLSVNITSALVRVVLFYGIRPVWHPRLGWSPAIVRDFVRFGNKVFANNVLQRALDQLDDVWTGVVLGNTALGFYSRAYSFALYPRLGLAKPLNQVVLGTYAQVQGDRKRLSRVFFIANGLLVRSGFLLAGILALIAPEFIRIAIGIKWLPMLQAFQLMLVYTLLDPIKVTVADVITVSGAPEKVGWARLVQLIVMIVGLVTLGPRLGIAGVALAVDLMVVVGIALLLWEARAFVDFSLRRIFLVPSLALLLGMGAAWAAAYVPGVPGSDWRTGLVKASVFSVLYAVIILLLEGRGPLSPRFLSTLATKGFWFTGLTAQNSESANLIRRTTHRWGNGPVGAAGRASQMLSGPSLCLARICLGQTEPERAG